MEAVDILECDPDCEPCLRMLHPGSVSGPTIALRMGDMLLVPPSSLRDADGYIGGFPCPPQSLLGQRGGVQDPRSLVFFRGLDHLEELANRRDKTQLKFYVVEYVAGAMKALKKGDPAFATSIQSELKRRIPHFVHDLWPLNTNMFGLSQDRNRIFFVGCHKMCMMAFGVDVLLSPGDCIPPHVAKLRDCLDACLFMPDIATTRTAKQVTNITHYKQLMDRARANDPDIQCGVCDHSRAADKVFGEFLHYEQAGTITTGDSSKWVLGEVAGKVWGTGRPFTMAERAKCQGMVPGPLELAFRTKTALNRVLGNTMGVDCIGSVIAALLPPIVAWERHMSSPAPPAVRRFPAEEDPEAAASVARPPKFRRLQARNPLPDPAP